MLKKLNNKAYKILRWSEKWMKTDMVYLASSGFWLSLAQFLMSLSGFFVAIAFANLLPKEIYGNYKFVISFIGILLIPTLDGLNVSYTQAVARGYEGSLNEVTKTRIKWGLLGSLAGFLIAGYYFYQGNFTLGACFILTALFIPIFDSFLSGAILSGRKQFKRAAIYTTAKRFSYMAAMIITLLLTDNIYFVLLAYLAVNSLSGLIGYVSVLINHKPNDKIDPQTISYGKHLSLMTVINTISSNADKIMLFHFLGAQKLAVYSFAVVLPDNLKAIIKTLSSAALPKLSAASPEMMKKTMVGKILRFMIVLIPFTIAYIAAAPLIYKILLPQYIDSVFYSQIFGLSIVLAPQVLFTTYLKSQMKKKELYFINTFTPLFKITLFVILIPLYGVMGLIISTLASRVASFFALLVLFKRS